jgi:hypothetical protein
MVPLKVPSALLQVCAPPCNPASDGFLLSVRGRAIRCLVACPRARLLDSLLACSTSGLIGCLLGRFVALSLGRLVA